MDGWAAGWSSVGLLILYDDDEDDNDDDNNDDDDVDDDVALRVGVRNRPSLIIYGLRCYSGERVDYVKFVDLKAE